MLFYKKKYYVIFIFGITISLLPANHLFGNNDDSKIKIFINNSKDLKTKKKKSQFSKSKSRGLEIKSLSKIESITKSKKEKKNLAVKKMYKEGLLTKNMVKNNRWFVKKPFKKSFNKISSIKRIQLPKIKTEQNKKISLMASDLSINRARETGPTKPETIFSGNSSRNAKNISKTQTRTAGPAKSGIIYVENSSRKAMKISKKRAFVTGPDKPKIIYLERVGRKAFEISSSKNKINNKKIINANYTVQRYSVEYLRNMSRRPPTKNTSFNNESNSLENILEK